MTRALRVIGLLLLVPLAACQTISHGTTQMVEVRSEPAGALVTVAGFPARTTPTFLLLPRNRCHTVSVTKEGFKPASVSLTASLAPGRATPDAGVMSVIGSAIDAASGGSWELKPDKLVVSLEPVASTGVLAASGAGGAAKGPAPAAEVKEMTATGKSGPVVSGTVPVPPIVTADAKAVLVEQLARIDRLLEQGVITTREHEVLRAAAIGAAALAGVPMGGE